jgi:ferredoxin
MEANLARVMVATRATRIELRGLTRLLTAWWYPRVFQIAGLIVFGLILWFAFTGNPHGELNFATVLTWRVWWALLPLSFFAVGKVWCAICPLATLSDLAQKLSPITRVTPRWLREYGVWIMGGAFLALSWAHAVFDIHGIPWITGVVFVDLALSAVLLALRYERRAFCRFACPVGLMSGIYATTSPLALRAGDATCRAGCAKQSCQAAPVCKLYEYPRTIDSNRYCVLCGECVDSCPHGSPQLTLRAPTSEIAEIRKPVFAEALFVVLLLGLVLVEIVRMTPVYPAFMQWAMLLTRVDNYTLVYSFALGLLLLVYVAVAVGVAYLASPTWKTNFTRFGYVFIPLALAGHLGTNLFELTAEGTRSVQVLINNLQIPLQLFDLPPKVRGSIYATDMNLMLVQYTLLTLGLVATLYAIHRLAQRTQTRALPYWAFASLAAAVFFVVYALPMKPGC